MLSIDYLSITNQKNNFKELGINIQVLNKNSNITLEQSNLFVDQALNGTCDFPSH